MIHRLRTQFVLSAAIAVLVVLNSVIGVINGTMRGLVYVQTNRVLDALSAWDSGAWSESSGTPPAAGTMLANRFFRVRISSDGSIAASDLGHASLLDEEDVTAIVSGMDLSVSRGRLVLTQNSAEAHYAYRVNLLADSGETSIIFLDVTAADAMTLQLLQASLSIGAISFVAFVGILAVLSRRAVRPVIQNMENQKRFITNAGHELKTPLAIISANTELLEAVYGENEWSQNILSQVRRLSGLIGELIALSRLSEREKVALERVELSPLLEAAAAEFRPLAEQQGKVLRTEIAPETDVVGEARALRELAGVLLDNAVKYCDDGGTVLVRLSQSGKTVALEVSNDYADGAGVDYSRFFERFYQQEQSHNSGKSGGFGIGLSTAQELVRIMRGKIQARWADGRITFRVTLNRAKTGESV